LPKNAGVTKFVQLADGRKLAFGEYEDPKGVPAIDCHGFPHSHLEAELFDSAANNTWAQGASACEHQLKPMVISFLKL
jgi:hypothetical protein